MRQKIGGKFVDLSMQDLNKELQTLGQFDEFYESYDIDENGSCFVKKEDRVKIY